MAFQDVIFFFYLLRKISPFSHRASVDFYLFMYIMCLWTGYSRSYFYFVRSRVLTRFTDLLHTWPPHVISFLNFITNLKAIEINNG